MTYWALPLGAEQCGLIALDRWASWRIDLDCWACWRIDLDRSIRIVLDKNRFSMGMIIKHYKMNGNQKKTHVNMYMFWKWSHWKSLILQWFSLILFENQWFSLQNEWFPVTTCKNYTYSHAFFAFFCFGKICQSNNWFEWFQNSKCKFTRILPKQKKRKKHVNMYDFWCPWPKKSKSMWICIMFACN